MNLKRKKRNKKNLNSIKENNKRIKKWILLAVPMGLAKN